MLWNTHPPRDIYESNYMSISQLSNNLGHTSMWSGCYVQVPIMSRHNIDTSGCCWWVWLPRRHLTRPVACGLHWTLSRWGNCPDVGGNGYHMLAARTLVKREMDRLTLVGVLLRLEVITLMEHRLTKWTAIRKKLSLKMRLFFSQKVRTQQFSESRTNCFSEHQALLYIEWMLYFWGGGIFCMTREAL